GVIFSTGEIGHVEDPSATPEQRAGLQKVVTDGGKAVVDPSLAGELKQELATRLEADQSTAYVTFTFLCCAIVWLVLASAFGLISSIKLHNPEVLTEYAWLTRSEERRAGKCGSSRAWP